jgi:hypothetical protein
MNKEEEEAPLEDRHVHQNCLAQERPVAQSKEQRTADANWQATQRGAHSDTQIATNVSRQIAQRIMRNHA